MHERVILLTGVTGFVGKVVLEELLRERLELGVTRIRALVRAEDAAAAADRLDREVAASRCLRRHPRDLHGMVEAVAGDLEVERCGLSEADRTRLEGEVTHIIHCAASVDFNLPLADATRINVDGALQMLRLARRCARLESMVSVSTAYATPHPGGEGVVEEVLAPLRTTGHPRDPRALYEVIVRGEVDEAQLLAEVGHPNTYTFTKCLAEHLLDAERGEVPLTLVRPSIVSASRRQPEPGWIDSSAALAAFVLMLGTGNLRVVAGDPTQKLDIVPCDEVSHRVVAAAFAAPPDPTAPIRIVHATAGLERSCEIGRSKAQIEAFFRRHPVMGGSRPTYIGPDRAHGGVRFEIEHAIKHRALGHAQRALLVATGQRKLRRKLEQLMARQSLVNETFSYFTHNTFDFRSRAALGEDFEPEPYMEGVCAGVHRHLMRQSPERIPFAGRRHVRRGSDLLWAMRHRPDEPWAIRACAFALAKIFDRCAHQISFDLPSFDAAMKALPKNALPVILPSHRSYLDFLLIPFLLYSRPDIGLALPHIAADVQFARIPVLGGVARAAGAFFIERGTGRADPRLAEEVARLVDDGRNILFFIEGARSRSRRFLRPKRGLIRSLQQTGAPLVALPIAIDFDRVPEEASFRSELAGDPAGRIEWGHLLRWLARLARGRVDIGHVQVTCGEPMPFDADADPHLLSQNVVDAIRSASGVSRYHLRCFLAHFEAGDLDLPFLEQAVEVRGGRLLESRLEPPPDLDPHTEMALREQWMHLFAGEALALYGDEPSIRQYLAHHHPSALSFEALRLESRDALDDPRMKTLVSRLYEPIVHHARVVAMELGETRAPSDPREQAALGLEVLRKHPDLYRPLIEDAVRFHAERP